MRNIGITAEYNPFHNGHKYMLDKLRADYNPHALICIMSGNFVQRGGPALQDKFTRAQAAIAGGADLVLELPAVYALSNAGGFAKGAVAVMKGLGCIDSIAFGSETGDAQPIKRAAELCASESPELSSLVKSKCEKGASYVSAFESSLTELYPEFSGLFEDGMANNLLAREYLKENLIQGAGLDAIAVKRMGAAHDASEAFGSEFASASLIRKLITEGDNSALQYVDKCCRTSESLSLGNHLNQADLKRYYDLVRVMLISMSADELANIAGVSEGLENLLQKAALECTDLDIFMHKVKSKRYTYAGISRILSQVLIGITKNDYDMAHNQIYAKVLAFNSVGAEVLKEAKTKASVPVITNINKQDLSACRGLIDIELKAGEMYSLIRGKSVSEYSDRVHIPTLK